MDMQKILTDLLKRVDALPSGTIFTVSTLYVDDEWKELRSCKRCLGSMYRREAERDARIEVRQKQEGKQQYYKR